MLACCGHLRVLASFDEQKQYRYHGQAAPEGGRCQGDERGCFESTDDDDCGVGRDDKDAGEQGGRKHGEDNAGEVF